MTDTLKPVDHPGSHLRPYQQEAVEAVLTKWTQFNKLLGVAPTGSGKTVIFSEVARRVAEDGGRVLVLAHREELIDQAANKLFQATGYVVGKEKGEFEASLGARIVVGSVQTLNVAKRRERFPAGHFTHIVVDEAHRALADSYQKVLSYWPDAKVLGVTATADRGDKKNLGEYFEDLAFEISLPDMIAQGYLSPIAVKTLPLRIDLSRVRKVAGDLNQADLEAALIPILGSAIDQIKKHAEGRKVLAFLPLINTAQAFAKVANQKGIKAEFVSGQCSDRREKVKRFRDGDFQLLANSMLLTEGYDDPSIDCVVVLRPTQSRALFTQMVGRGTRINPGKENLLLLDFLWVSKRFQLAKAANLIASSQEEADDMTRLLEAQAQSGQAFELGAVQKQARLNKEARIAKRLAEEAAKQKASERAAARKALPPEELALLFHDTELVDYQPSMRWESKRITPKQKAYLDKMGLDTSYVMTMGHAGKVIQLLEKRYNAGLATLKQVRCLKTLGHKEPHTVKFADASHLIGELIAKRNGRKAFSLNDGNGWLP